jgi:hypothetical protein
MYSLDLNVRARTAVISPKTGQRVRFPSASPVEVLPSLLNINARMTLLPSLQRTCILCLEKKSTRRFAAVAASNLATSAAVF